VKEASQTRTPSGELSRLGRPESDARPAASTAAPAVFLQRLGPLGYLCALGGLLLASWSLSRAALALHFGERVARVEDFGWLFPVGLRMDSVSASYALVLPALLLLALPRAALVRLRLLLLGYFALLFTAVVALEAISFDFVEQYDARPNLLFVESLGFSLEIARTLWKQYALNLALALSATLAAGVLGWWLAGRIWPAALAWSLGRRLATGVLVLPLLFLGMRGTLDHRGVNASTAAFSSDNLVNQLALNSTYTTLHAALARKHERSASRLYGRMDEAEILARVARYAPPAAARAANDPIPFLHVQPPRTPRARPRNLVIVLEESLGAEFVGCLGGKPLTPEFDRLSQEGLLLTQLYCTGTRTVRGIEAVVSGFLPTPGSSVVKLPRSQSGFFTLAALLRRHGYATWFVYGGEAHFDNMAAFFLGNGFEHALSQADYEDPVFRGTWGVSDEDLMREADEVFAAQGERPFFALVLSTSNHSPYEFPDGRIELHDAEKATRNNTVKYADYALGELFRRARTRPYFEHTDWLVVADHDERTYGDDLIPVSKFHIPGLFLGPDFAPGRHDGVASQIDLVPTLLSVLGIETEHPLIGRDLLALPPADQGVPGRAILQFADTYGFMLGTRVAVLPGAGAPRCFDYLDGRLVARPLDEELVRDARAHALLPELLYSTGRYRLP